MLNGVQCCSDTISNVWSMYDLDHSLLVVVAVGSNALAAILVVSSEQFTCCAVSICMCKCVCSGWKSSHGTDINVHLNYCTLVIMLKCVVLTYALYEYMNV